MSPAVPRVLVVYGSETGNVRRGIHGCVREWQACAETSKMFELASPNVMSGNEVAQEFSSLSEVGQNFDVLVVATSSFGEGDPPANFAKFLLMLVRAANAERNPSRKLPLAKMQHAVVGYGQSVYPTFQSCPRYTDKLLEDLGSRRMVRRVELDEGPDETIAAGWNPDDSSFTAMGSGPSETDKDVAGRSVALKRFTLAVQDALLKASSTVELAHVCPWTEPGDSLVEKTEDELMFARPETLPDGAGLPQWVKYMAVALAAAAATQCAQQFLE